MAADPRAVDMKRVAHHDAAVEPTREQFDARTFAEHYPNGVMGLDPSAATEALGKHIWDIAVDLCVAELENW
jgi:creatinine amidohydrolase/Fe(II)-dependent formamide hydrolase-like protein